MIWGDVAYKKGTFMHPDYWRKYYKPWVTAIVDHAHTKGLDVIYHGCGNVNTIFADYIEIGIDAYNPLEVKAGMDVLDLRRRFGHRMGFCGNSDIQVWETGDRAGHPPRSAAQAQRRPRRRVHLPVRPFGVQLGLRAHVRLHRQAGARVRASIRCGSASSTSTDDNLLTKCKQCNLGKGNAFNA